MHHKKLIKIELTILFLPEKGYSVFPFVIKPEEVIKLRR